MARWAVARVMAWSQTRVERVLHDVLDSGPFGAGVGLGPQVGLSVGSTPDLQGDEVVLLVVPGGGITLVRVPGGELLAFEPGREGRRRADGCCPSSHADRLAYVGLVDRRVDRARCPRTVRQ